MYLIVNSKETKFANMAVVNQAIENYFVNDLQKDGHGVMIYASNPAVIIGRDDNIWETLNVPLMNQYHLELVRKPINSNIQYNDSGTLKINEIIGKDDGNFENYDYFAKPILKALENLGVTAKLKDRTNQLQVNDKTFGRIQMQKNARGYTVDVEILFKVNQDIAKKVILEPSFDELINLASELPSKVSLDDLREAIIKVMFNVDDIDDAQDYQISTTDWEQIEHSLADEFGLDSWNYGHNAGYGQYADEAFSAGKLGINFTVVGNQFTAFKFVPFFKIEGDLSAIETALVGSDTSDDAIEKAVDQGHLKTLEKQKMLNFITHKVVK